MARCRAALPGSMVSMAPSMAARTEGRVSDVAESLLVFREQQPDGGWKHDYLLSNEITEDPPVERAWV